MSVAYMSHDEVNSALALRMAGRLGLNLTVLAVRDAEHAIAADLLVLDLDHLPSECKTKLFTQIGCGEVRGGMAVHSYNLTDAEIAALKAANVRVRRRLTAAVLVERTPSGSTS